jgi:hypothetical protein
VRDRLQQAPGLARRLIRHPRWLVESVRLARARRRHKREGRARPFDISVYGDIVVSLHEALADIAPHFFDYDIRKRMPRVACRLLEPRRRPYGLDKSTYCT